jgi:Na+-transporting NADH:ubiquinone oxidoreductase subunit NqrC
MKNKYFLKAKTEIRIQIVNLILKAMCLQMKVITTICRLFLKQIQKNMKKFNKKIKIFLVWQIPIANKIIK